MFEDSCGHKLMNDHHVCLPLIGTTLFSWRDLQFLETPSCSQSSNRAAAIYVSNKRNWQMRCSWIWITSAQKASAEPSAFSLILISVYDWTSGLDVVLERRKRHLIMWEVGIDLLCLWWLKKGAGFTLRVLLGIFGGSRILREKQPHVFALFLLSICVTMCQICAHNHLNHILKTANNYKMFFHFTCFFPSLAKIDQKFKDKYNNVTQ